MIPNYLAIKEAIEKGIETGEYKIGHRLPSEYEMAKKFSVSRETFRAAVKLLEQEGKLFVKHGVGTFVVNPLPSIPSSLEKLQSIGSMIQFAGLEEGERQESLSRLSCREDWAKALGIKSGDPVITLERVRTANGEPVAFSLNIIPKAYVGETFTHKEFSGSLFQFLEGECQIKVTRADSELIVPLPSDPNYRKLKVTPQTTVLLMKQIHYDESNRAVLYSQDYLRNDIFHFRIRRNREFVIGGIPR